MLEDYGKLLIEAYIESGISEREFLILVAIYEEDKEFLDFLYHSMYGYMRYDHAVNKLEQSGLVKKHGGSAHDLMLRKRGEELFKKHVKVKRTRKSDVPEWIEDWRSIFPAGTNFGGYRYRGNKLECLKKMIKFVDSHDFTKEEIFEATRKYVERFAVRGYSYMQQAHYFIEKRDTGSALEAECEGLREVKTEVKTEGPGYGRTIR